MQPPRSRSPQIDFASTDTLRALILNTTAVLTTALLIRFATLLVRDSNEQTVPSIIQMITTPLVWPFQFVPVLGNEIIVDAMLVDIVMIPAVALIGLFTIGVLTGWRETSGGTRPYQSIQE